MLALKRPQKGSDNCTVNVLPCRIHHDGPTKVTKRYWCPHTEKDGTPTAHFRGRKLRGRVLHLPAGYQGVVAKPTNQLVRPFKNKSRPTYTTVDDDIEIQDDDDDEPAEPVTVLEALSSFDEVVVWGHDQVPASDDAFAKGLNEWIEFAQAIHGRPDKQTQQGPENDTSQPNA